VVLKGFYDDFIMKREMKWAKTERFVVKWPWRGRLAFLVRFWPSTTAWCCQLEPAWVPRPLNYQSKTYDRQFSCIGWAIDCTKQFVKRHLAQ